MDFKKLNLDTLQKYTSPQAVKDLDTFLDQLPANAGYNALIAAGITALMAGASVWFAAQETSKVSKLHADLINVQALQPPVPVLKYVPVSQKMLKPLADKVGGTFKGVTIAVPGDGSVTLNAQDTDYFPQFLASISYLQRGGKSWKVRVNKMCVGRECKGAKLTAELKVDSVTFGEPEKKEAPAATDLKEVVKDKK